MRVKIAMRMLVLAVAGLGAAGCTSWVDLTRPGEQVRVRSPNEVSTCNRVGTTTVTTKDRLAGVERDRDAVAEELRRLARNSAVDVGGDTVVPNGPHQEGHQVFDIYRCR